MRGRQARGAGTAGLGEVPAAGEEAALAKPFCSSGRWVCRHPRVPPSDRPSDLPSPDQSIQTPVARAWPWPGQGTLVHLAASTEMVSVALPPTSPASQVVTHRAAVWEHHRRQTDVQESHGDVCVRGLPAPVKHGRSQSSSVTRAPSSRARTFAGLFGSKDGLTQSK